MTRGDREEGAGDDKGGGGGGRVEGGWVHLLSHAHLDIINKSIG